MNLHFFFFNDTATTEIYTLSLHDALPISFAIDGSGPVSFRIPADLDIPPGAAQTFTLGPDGVGGTADEDRKSTRLNSSHLVISYAVFCLKKKKDAEPRAAQQHTLH